MLECRRTLARRGVRVRFGVGSRVCIPVLPRLAPIPRPGFAPRLWIRSVLSEAEEATQARWCTAVVRARVRRTHKARTFIGIRVVHPYIACSHVCFPRVCRPPLVSPAARLCRDPTARWGGGLIPPGLDRDANPPPSPTPRAHTNLPTPLLAGLEPLPPPLPPPPPPPPPPEPRRPLPL